MVPERIGIYGGKAVVSSAFSILYETSAKKPILLWWRKPGSATALSFLKSPSGSGKTTLLEHLWDRLRRRDCPQGQLSFDFSPDLEPFDTASVGYVPQNPPMVNHWAAGEIIRSNSRFLECFFSGAAGNSNEHAFFRKRLGEFSGGQRRKLYACSALERLQQSGSLCNFLLLDETLDGVGAGEASETLKAIRQQWDSISARYLFVLLVTHLDETNLTAALPDSQTVKLAVTNSLTHGPLGRVTELHVEMSGAHMTTSATAAVVP